MILAGCGGGGGGSHSSVGTPSNLPTGPATPVVIPGDIQNTVPALTYSPASQEYAFVTALNDFRSRLGLGLLAQNQQLDTASANHLAYLLLNDKNYGGTVDFNGYDPVSGRSWLHIENGALQKFTGAQELERAKFANYTGTYVGEEVTFGGGLGGTAAFGTLAQTVYHRAGLALQNVREVGVAVGSDRSQTVVMEMGLKTAQSVSSDYIGVYPYDRQVGVALHAYVESPNPYIGELSTANDDFPTKTSMPISVSVASGHTITVTAFTVVEAAQASPLAGRLMTSANDPNRYLDKNVAFWTGKAPFKAATTYSVKFSGTNDNVPFSKEWSFTTK